MYIIRKDIDTLNGVAAFITELIYSTTGHKIIKYRLSNSPNSTKKCMIQKSTMTAKISTLIIEGHYTTIDNFELYKLNKSITTNHGKITKTG